MKKTLRWLDVNFEAILMVLFFSLMILLVTVQVVLRFIFKTGFSWGEEVARLLFVWMSFSSFGYLTRGSRHVRVGFFRELFPVRTQKAILILCDVLFLVFSAGGLRAMVQLCSDAWRFQDMLTAVPWNYNALYLAGKGHGTDARSGIRRSHKVRAGCNDKLWIKCLSSPVGGRWGGHFRRHGCVTVKKGI